MCNTPPSIIGSNANKPHRCGFLLCNKCPACLFSIRPLRVSCSGLPQIVGVIIIIAMIHPCVKGKLIFYSSYLQTSATAMRIATTRAKMDTIKMVRTPARFPPPQRTGRITKRVQLKGIRSVAVTLLVGPAKAVPGLRKARQTHGRAPSLLSPVPPALEKNSRARTRTIPKRTNVGQ